MNEMFILALLAAGGAAICLAFVKSDKPVISALKSAGCGVENPYKGTYKRNHEGDYHATE